jgi:hypothetical protein
MSKQITDNTKLKLLDYKSTSLAKVLIAYAIDYGYSINEIAVSAKVSRMTINNWINDSEVRQKNLANLVINLEFESYVSSMIQPGKFEDKFDAQVIKKYAELNEEWLKLQKLISDLKTESLDIGKTLSEKKYFKYYGRQMIDEALNGFWNFDPPLLPVLKEDFEDLEGEDSYFEFYNVIKRELEEDGFDVGLSEERFSFLTLPVINSEEWNRLFGKSYTTELSSLKEKIENYHDIQIGWLGASVDEKMFSWFLEWLHTPGRLVMEKIFSQITQKALKGINRLELPFYTITDDDYDEDGYTELKNDEMTYGDDETSLYFEGDEIPVDEAILREFFAIKGFKFSLTRNANGLNEHDALISW